MSALRFVEERVGALALALFLSPCWHPPAGLCLRQRLLKTYSTRIWNSTVRFLKLAERLFFVFKAKLQVPCHQPVLAMESYSRICHIDLAANHLETVDRSAVPPLARLAAPSYQQLLGKRSGPWAPFQEL